MEVIKELARSPLDLCVPIAVVVVVALLVFAFGFQSPEQPPFERLAGALHEDRKGSTKKKKQPVKDKKTANGFAAPVAETKSDKTKRSPAKEPADSPKLTKEKKESPKQAQKKEVRKPTEEVKKKNTKNKFEKPADFDEGDWEIVGAKGEKKKKESPVKKEGNKKKNTEENKENKVENVKKEPEPAPQVEEQKPKKEKKPKKKEEKKEKVEVVPENNIPEQSKPQSGPAQGDVVFDELGDVWTEAKVPKKTKKKAARRDN